MINSILRVHDWMRLDPAARRELLRRPAQRDQEETMAGTRAIVERVRRDGDRALRQLTAEHDHVQLEQLRVSRSEEHTSNSSHRL